MKSALVGLVGFAIGALLSTHAFAKNHNDAHSSSSHETHGHSHADAVMVHDPWLRATLPNAKVAAGYMVIRNVSDQEMILKGGSVAFAARVEVHEMIMQNDVMKMRPLEGGLVIPAGEEVALTPGGHHLMIMGLTSKLDAGMQHDVTLHFEGAEDVTLSMDVQPIGHGRSSNDSHDHGAEKTAGHGHGQPAAETEAKPEHTH